MKIVILDDDTIIGHSSELPWQRYAEAIEDARNVMKGKPSKLAPLSEDEQREIEEEHDRPGSIDLEDAKVIALVAKSRRQELSESEKEDILTGCVAFWLSTPEIIVAFDRMAPYHDGEVRILPTGLVAGWRKEV